MFQLTVDTREQAIRPYLEQLFDNTTDPIIKKFSYEIVQINIGDFIISYGKTPLCCIERKTMIDFSASIRDQRYTVNTEKMINLRTKTGCKLVYIVECDIGFPAKTKVFAKMPYSSIESAMDSLMLQHDIHVIKTKNNEHTLLRIIDLMKKYEKINRQQGIIENPMEYLMDETILPDAAASIDTTIDTTIDTMIGTIIDTTTAAGGESLIQALTEKEIGEITEMINKREPRSTEYNTIELWSSLHGISLATAKVIITKCTIIEFVQNPLDHHTKFTTESGRSLTKKAVESLFDLAAGNETVMIKCLSAIDGISADVASQIVEATDKCKFSEYSIEKLSMVKIKQKTRTISLGAVKSKKIIDTLNYCK